MNRTLRMWMIWVIAAAAPFFIFPSEAAVWDGPRSHPAAQKVEDAYVYINMWIFTDAIFMRHRQSRAYPVIMSMEMIIFAISQRIVLCGRNRDESNLTQNAEERLKSFMKRSKKAQGNKVDGRPLFGAVFSCEKKGTGNISFICSWHTD